MPGYPASVCSSPGCSILCRDGNRRCAKHQIRPGKWADPARGNAEQNGYGKAWRVLRAAAMERDSWTCQVCIKRGRTEPAYAVDHIIPKAEGGTDDMDNLQAICRPCHAIKTQIEAARGAARTGAIAPADNYPDWLTAANCNLQIVFGPPGAGKSTYVSRNLGPDDQLIDLDEILVELTGKPIYTAPEYWLDHAIRIRNSRLGNLKRAPERQRVWFITSGADSYRREWWVNQLRPRSSITLDTPLGECIARINADTRRPPEAKARHIEAARQWWQNQGSK